MKQVRFIPIATCGLKVREGEGQEESRTVVGTPIVFGVRSVNLTPWSSYREVYEVMEPGCISDQLLRESDVILNLNHNSLHRQRRARKPHEVSIANRSGLV